MALLVETGLDCLKVKAMRTTRAELLSFRLPQNDSGYWECAEELRRSFAASAGVLRLGLDARHRRLRVFYAPAKVDRADLIRLARRLGAEVECNA